MLQEHPNSMDYVMGDISRAVLDQVMSDKKFYEDALVVKQTRMQSVMSTDFEAEIYICKHPTKVKR
jgi:GTPase